MDISAHSSAATEKIDGVTSDARPSRAPVPDEFRQSLIPSDEVEAAWLAHFLEHYDRHWGANTSGLWILAPAVKAGLQRSLPTFQVGEMGTGEHLIRAAHRMAGPEYVATLRLFVREEQEHARLLALVCHALDIELIDNHWTDGVFQWARKVAGLRAEVLMLLVAEFVSLQFYETLREGVGDPVLTRIFGAIADDEQRHLEFHAATLPKYLDRWSRPVWQVARAIWVTVLVGTTAVVAFDHRKVLRACGSSVTSFIVGGIREIRRGVPRFFQANAEASAS